MPQTPKGVRRSCTAERVGREDNLKKFSNFEKVPKIRMWGIYLNTNRPRWCEWGILRLSDAPLSTYKNWAGTKKKNSTRMNSFSLPPQRTTCLPLPLPQGTSCCPGSLPGTLLLCGGFQSLPHLSIPLEAVCPNIQKKIKNLTIHKPK